FAYVVRNGRPLYLAKDSPGDGTVIEDMRTGKQLALLPGVTSRISIAPGNRTAVSSNDNTERGGEQPRWILWDLESSSRRAELSFPDNHWRVPVMWSADGRHLIAHSASGHPSSEDVQWWDAASGKLLGVANYAKHTVLIDS